MNSAFVKTNASLESPCEKQSADVPAPVLQVASELGVEPPLAPPEVLRASTEHHLRRVAAANARYLRNDSGPLWRDRPQARLSGNKSVRGRQARSTICAVWPWMRDMALSATCRPISPTAAIACCCPASWSPSTSGCWPTTYR